MIDLHRHDEFSTFDGFGKAKDLAMIAKELGHTSLGTSNHGNTNGLVQTYMACKEAGIKAVLGVEGYFLPKYKQQTRGYHLCLFAKNLEGYKNINTLQYEGEKQKYYNPIITFDLLEQHHEGVICTSACIAGYLSQCVIKGKKEAAEKYIGKMVDIFGDDFYIEIQPYKVSDEGLQESVNEELMRLARKFDVKCILTSDSHRGRKDELSTYIKMHQIAGHNIDHIEATYGERYMPTEDEIVNRFVDMHEGFFSSKKEAKKAAKMMIKNLEEIEAKVEDNMLDGLQLEFPKLEKCDSKQLLINNVKKGLKSRGVYNKKYIKRCKEELEVIIHHGFADYFLIVQDYVAFAKSKGIAVGPGRGSVCNSLVAYALGITEVDSIFFDLDFRRFLRMDKKKIPDIDLDFQTNRRHEVIEYLVNKYKGHAARICAYGLYKVDNLVNDLAKVCGLQTTGDIDDEEKQKNKNIISEIKAHIRTYMDGEELDHQCLLNDATSRKYNRKYDNIIEHFTKLYKKVRYIGTHAAGVAITGGDLLQYTAIRVDKDGNLFTNYDLIDIEKVNVIKFDILGLKTMESINDLRSLTGDIVDYTKITQDEKLLQEFKAGNCDGVFQFEKHTPRDILRNIGCDCFDDIVAATSMNRPGPLSLGMPDAYANNKYNKEEAMATKYYQYTKETYGTIIYQEQIMQICVYIGGMEWGTADKIIKMMKSTSQKAEELAQQKDMAESLLAEFWSGAQTKGFTKEEAEDVFVKMTDSYSFNKGHGVGYSLISVEEMYYKFYHPTEYWFVKMKYAKDEGERYKFALQASKQGVLVFLPHVNYTCDYCLRKIDGEKVIQQGLVSVKSCGRKAAEEIEKERRENGPFKSEEDFMERCKSRVVNKRVIDVLKECGALEFNKKRYINRVVKYNSSLVARC